MYNSLNIKLFRIKNNRLERLDLQLSNQISIRKNDGKQR